MSIGTAFNNVVEQVIKVIELAGDFGIIVD
jgi:hypothetical protein